MQEKVIEIISKQLKKDPKSIGLDTRLIEDLGADSLDVVELLMAFEEEFDLTVPDEEAIRFKTVGDIVSFIQDKI